MSDNTPGLTEMTANTDAPGRRVFNFGAGPAMLPIEVMRQAREELLDWQGTGISVIEMSHRSKHFASIVEDSESDLRELLDIPDSHAVLFLQGGASSQFAMVPMNLQPVDGIADYVHTGIWSGKAIDEARKFGDVNVAASAADNNFTEIPAVEDWCMSDDAAYVYYTDNETIGGLEFPEIPVSNGTLLVSDMTSNFLSRKIDVSRFAVIIAGSQKNIGPAGLVIVIVKKDLLGQARSGTPSLYDYAIQDGAGSLYNTPPTFTWYMAGLVFKWVKQRGGVAAMLERSMERSSRLYEYIDNSEFYSNPVAVANRSRMNIPFTLADDKLNDDFLAESKRAGLIELKGHRSVGGMRASLYNAMPVEGVDTLISFMSDFSRKYG